MNKNKSFLRHTTTLFLLLAGGISVVLFSVKYQVQDLEENRISLIGEIRKEKQAIHVLGAEWSFLNDPNKLAELSTRHLGLLPASPKQLYGSDIIKNIPMTIDARGGK